MVDPGCFQTTSRSGSFASQPTELDPNAASSGDNEYHHSNHDATCSPGPSSVKDQSHTPFDDNAPQQHVSLPSSHALHVRTDLPDGTMAPTKQTDRLARHSISSGSLSQRTPSFHALGRGVISATDSLSPASALSSPLLGGMSDITMSDITPLPSPIGGFSSWRLSNVDSLSLSRTSSSASRPGSGMSLRLSDSNQMLRPTRSPSTTNQCASLYKLGEEAGESPSKPRRDGTPKHARNRSLSEYIPPGRSALNQRPVAVSGNGALGGIVSSPSVDANANDLHREQYLAVQRGIALTAQPPTPPRSSRSGEGDSDNEPVITHSPSLGLPDEVYSVRSVQTQQPRKYRKLRQLGQGTFSQVSLAVRIEHNTENGASNTLNLDGASYATRKLVAVKIIEYGPAGGADEQRLEVSLKREVDILKTLNHPSLVQLKAFGCDDKRALLVLSYCPGGDLFDVAASKSKPMRPELTRRIFAELVAAVRYLHENLIVHRDIKLENILVTLPADSIEKITDWRTYDRAVVTLSDLGLSRRIPQPPESALLRTRCGSEDYAAPELLMGQPYEGRSTDAWALGVLLYAMMENRLPFDALPGTRGDPAKLRARTPHRIARCEWSWYRYADEDGEWDPQKGNGMEGARDCVESLLKRNTKRKSLDEIAGMPWVRDAIDVPGGLKRGDREVP